MICAVTAGNQAAASAPLPVDPWQPPPGWQADAKTRWDSGESLLAIIMMAIVTLAAIVSLVTDLILGPRPWDVVAMTGTVLASAATTWRALRRRRAARRAAGADGSVVRSPRAW
jgi:hypothetical protein